MPMMLEIHLFLESSSALAAAQRAPKVKTKKHASGERAGEDADAFR